MSRQVNAAGLKLIEESEGLRLDRYLDCAGKPTIGWGHLCRPGDGLFKITREQAEQLLIGDVASACRSVENLVKVPLTDNEFACLVDFAFNFGAGALGTSTLLRLLNRGNYDAVPEQLPHWVHAGGKVEPGLVIRRKRAAELWSTADDAKGAA